jgi:hypothetical protein
MIADQQRTTTLAEIVGFSGAMLAVAGAALQMADEGTGFHSDHHNTDGMYYLNVYRSEARHAGVAVEDYSRLSLRVRAEDKATLLRAVALTRTDLTDSVLQQALLAARAVIAAAHALPRQ